MEETAEALLPYAGFSTFIAGQVVADLRWALSGAWKDRMTWAPIGPGSKRGMNRLYSNQKDAKISKEDFYEKFKEIMNWVSMSLDPNLFSKLEAMDIQNCLCEFDKYERTLWNEGRPKQKYPGMN